MTNSQSRAAGRYVSVRAQEILELAASFSNSEGYQKTTAIHVLQAMLAVGRSPIRDTLNQLGLTGELLHRFLTEHRGRLETMLANEHDCYLEWDQIVTYSFGASASHRFAMAKLVDDVDLLYGFALMSRMAGLADLIRQAHGRPRMFTIRVIHNCKRMSKDGNIAATVDPTSKIHLLLTDVRDRSALFAARNDPGPYAYTLALWMVFAGTLHYYYHNPWVFASIVGLLVAYVLGASIAKALLFVRKRISLRSDEPYVFQ
ncbi:hypothetical protein [Ferrimicrobium sp.]|uniref:hypothetical protein n=1 Tax=Ferrimicrobium sp. TaxID=2926050 RepID=UPI002608FC27|nr:hypothetical protein [Ferrimicrobium sp.]